MKARDEGDDTDYEDIISKGLSEILDGVTYDDVKYHIDNFPTKLDRTIKKKVDKETAETLREYIDEHGLQNMIYLEAQNTRSYPGGSLASHMIGFTNTDGDGLYGLEYQYDEYLSGVDGYYIVARDSYGNEMPFDYAYHIPAVDGYDLQTTIDSSIQSFLEEQLEATVEKYQAANRACGIVMNVNTGAIYAMATTSSFDLNDPWTLDELSKTLLESSGYKEGTDEYSNYQRDLLTAMWSNKPVAESYIPGSTFKIVTSAMALEEIKSEIPTSVDCRGWLKWYGETIRCHKTDGHGHLTFAEGLQQSCNVWFMTLGDLIGASTFSKYAKAFGYRERTGIDLPGEASSIFASDLDNLNLYIYAFGQNFNVTPIQQITAVSAVANGGSLVTPYIVEKITDGSGNVIYQHKTEVKRQVVSEDVCKEISRILEEGVSGNGGAKNAGVEGYLVAAKTGTSEKKGTGESIFSVSDYVGMSIENAKKSIEDEGLTCVVIGDYNSDTVVAKQSPVAKSKIAVANGTVMLFTNANKSVMTKVPPVEGKTLAEAKRLFSEAGLNFNMDINGTRVHSTIIEQSIVPGEYVEKGSIVQITFPEGYVCSTVAYAPADNPEIAVIIIVDEPTKGSVFYGSSVAAPYVSGVLEKTLPYLGFEPTVEEK